MSEFNDKGVDAGISPYRRSFLRIYDHYVLHFSCRFLWRCPSSTMLEMYRRCITYNHMDIGVGTGYFIEHCNLSANVYRLALMDLNTNSLREANNRLVKFHPEIYQRNVLEPFNLGVPNFDSIAMMNLIHCLPGDMNSKSVVFRNAIDVLNPGGILFGSTILYRSVRRNMPAILVMRYYNRRGYMTNMEDDVGALERNLSRYFSKSTIKVIGSVALFTARK